MKIKVSKKYTTRFKKMAFAGEPESEVLSIQSMFDEKGNLVEEIRIDENDQEEKHLFTYNANGKLIKHDLIIEADGVSETFEYSRDEKDRIVEETKFYGEDEGECVVYEYAAHDQPVLIERYDSDNELESIEKILYNEKDMLIEHHRFNPENELLETTWVIYNDKDLPIGKKSVYAKLKTGNNTILSYDEQDRLIRLIEQNAEGKIISDVRTIYDERGNVIERQIRDFHSRTLRFAFDERNNCIEEEVFDEHGNLTLKSNYEYDEYNNLVSESGYFLDINRGAQMANTQSRYEYEFWDA